MEFQPGETPITGMYLERVRMDRPSPAPSFGLSRFTVEPGMSTTLDVHPDREYWFIASGNGEVAHDGRERLEVGPGDILHFSPYRSHTLKNTGESRLLAFSLWWE